jgi:deoxyribonuclease V
VAIALLDVDYRATGARAACVLAESWTDATPSSEHSVDISSVEEYEPGNFYRRELPCLLEVIN